MARLRWQPSLPALVYLNALDNPFVYDDHHTVVENPSIDDVSEVRAIVLGDMTRPVVNFSYALDRAIWGASHSAIHVTNVLLHMLNVVLLFRLACGRSRTGRPAGGELIAGLRAAVVAIATAAAFGLHPMMTEAVGYISGRSEVLCATFFMLALLAGRRWMRRRRRRAGWR